MDMFYSHQRAPKEDFNDSYKKIYSKLKKKGILRKPNYGEAISELTQLSNALKRENPIHPYAAFCLLGISRCEQALKNPTMEAAALADGGYLFWLNETQNATFGIFTIQEDLNEAIECYLLAIKIYRSQKKLAMAAALYYEMAGILQTLYRFNEARDYYHYAAELQQNDSTLCAINSLERAVDCNVKLRDYKSSCADLIWIMKLASEVALDVSSPVIIDATHDNAPPISVYNAAAIETTTIKKRAAYSVYAKVMMESRISLILLLILQGDFQQSSDFVSKLEKDAVSSGIETVSFGFLSCLLDTLVKECEKQNIDGVSRIHRELYSSLTKQQNEMLLLIIEELNNIKNLVNV